MGVDGELTQADIDRVVTLSIAESGEDARLPWAGHLGLSLLKPVSQHLAEGPNDPAIYQHAQPS